MDGSNDLSNRTKNQSIQLSDLSLGFGCCSRSSLIIGYFPMVMIRVGADFFHDDFFQIPTNESDTDAPGI
jgi:hypothetical protein